MRRFSIKPGQRLTIDGAAYLITDRDGRDAWRLFAAELGIHETWPHEKLLAFYVAGRLGPEDGCGEEIAKPSLFSELTEGDRARVEFRYAFLQRVDALMTGVPKNGRRQALERALEVASHELDRGALVARATYQRWKASLRERSDICDLAGQFHARGRRGLADRVGEIARGVMAQAVAEASAKEPVFRSMQWMRAEMKERIEAENLRLGFQQLSPPSRSAAYGLWSKFPEHQRDVVKHGKRQTRALYRSPGSRIHPELPLDLGEYDETRLPMFFFDEVSGVPLGRPRLNWVLDAATAMPAGFYLGFEPPGDLTAASTIRHACLPKTYVADEYPDIIHAYPAHGIFRRFTFDNEAMVHGDTAEMITRDLLSHYSIAPSHTPWFKSTVEGMFNALNRRFLQELPGFVLSRDLSPSEYDPGQNGCIGLRYFLYLFHTWLIDVYCQAPVGQGGLSPDERWRRGVEIWPPDLISRSRDLDLLFGIVRTGRLDHRGVRFRSLWYYSDELHQLRLREGHTQHVPVKINPTNLRFVHVRDPAADRWVRAEALKATYADGLSLHMHELQLKADAAAAGRSGEGDLERAAEHLRALIADSVGAALSLQAGGLMARAVGLGTQHIFDHMDADGRLGPLSGPFSGQELNPWKPAPEADPEPNAPPPELRRRIVPNIPKLRADRSLQRPSGGSDGGRRI